MANFSEPTQNEQMLLDRIAKLEGVNAAQSQKQRMAALNLRISGSGLPKGLQGKLKTYAGSAQFSENGKEEARMTVSQVIDLFKTSLPKDILQMSETNPDEGGVAVLEGEHEEGDEFYADKDGKVQMTQQQAAQEARAGIPKRKQRLIDAETAEVEFQPNTVKIKRGPGRPKKDATT